MKHWYVFGVMSAVIVTPILAKDPVFHLKNNSSKLLKVELIGLNDSVIFSQDYIDDELLLQTLPENEEMLRRMIITYCPTSKICDRASEVNIRVDFNPGNYSTYYLKFDIDNNNKGIVEQQKGTLGKTTKGYSLSKNIKPASLRISR